jgi:hypothetical protein
MLGLDRAADYAEGDRRDREHPDGLILVSVGQEDPRTRHRS